MPCASYSGPHLDDSLDDMPSLVEISPIVEQNKQIAPKG